ncbi:MAG TPA: tRNA epoxyqueuosine(34) reductase QueG [Phycisphaerales bacterium]|nr:tRNA epoxyqueuosine(34) reductase QueG [Phycisphaerales bacterium]
MARQHLPERDRPIGEPPPGFDRAAASRAVLSMLIDGQGFALAGIAPADASLRAAELSHWLAAGSHAEMDYMAADTAIRMDPRGILAGTRAFVVVADQYATRNDPPDTPEFGVGRTARYARGKNYHDVMKRRMHRVADAMREQYPFAEFRSCVDTAPVNERELATIAGLGWQGKNTMVIHPRLGSYFVLGVIATTLPLEPLAPPVPDSCGTCTRCIDACPTRAITPYHVDGSKCISYLTIEQRTIPESITHATQDWLAGCDICQEVCPHNSPRADGSTGAAYRDYAPQRTGFALVDVLAWGEDQRRAALTNSALKRITLPMFKRNAVWAAAHWLKAQPDHPHAPALRAQLERLARDPAEPEPLRRLARSVLAGWAGTSQ